MSSSSIIVVVICGSSRARADEEAEEAFHPVSTAAAEQVAVVMSVTKQDELDDAKVAELRDLFSKFDADRSGTVAFEHVDEILRTAARVIVEPEFKKRVKSTAPDDLQQKVQFPEFLDMVQKCTRAFNPQTDLQDAFRVFDRDGHGFITTAELRHVVTTLGERMTDEEADELIREADPNNEGQVDYENFIKIISTPVYAAFELLFSHMLRVSTRSPPDQYGVPPKKRPPQSTELLQPGPDSVVPSASDVPAQRASVSALTEAQTALSEVAAAAGEGRAKSGETSAPSSEPRSDKPGQGPNIGKASVSGSGKGSTSTRGKGSAEGSKKSSRKGSGTGDTPVAVSSASGPPVEAVVPGTPAEKKDGEVANK
ncbi:uncharacterized protein [Dermacentor albipictus]|uniref:uncharacterized protein isoform X1 n=1 Tax=Dermacentor albipictus TaxID=60249 RepID=UPI0031FE33E9